MLVKWSPWHTSCQLKYFHTQITKPIQPMGGLVAPDTAVTPRLSMAFCHQSSKNKAHLLGTCLCSPLLQIQCWWWKLDNKAWNFAKQHITVDSEHPCRHPAGGESLLSVTVLYCYCLDRFVNLQSTAVLYIYIYIYIIYVYNIYIYTV